VSNGDLKAIRRIGADIIEQNSLGFKRKL